MDKNSLIVWRNCCKPALQAICNNLASINPANRELSTAADETLADLMACIDTTIDLLLNMEEGKNESVPKIS